MILEFASPWQPVHWYRLPWWCNFIHCWTPVHLSAIKNALMIVYVCLFLSKNYAWFCKQCYSETGTLYSKSICLLVIGSVKFFSYEPSKMRPIQHWCDVKNLASLTFQCHGVYTVTERFSNEHRYLTFYTAFHFYYFYFYRLLTSLLVFKHLSRNGLAFAFKFWNLCSLPSSVLGDIWMLAWIKDERRHVRNL